MIIIGIDPGIKGALAFLRDGVVVDVIDAPVVGTGNGPRQELDLPQMARIIDATVRAETVHAFIEQVGAMPGQGVSSMFSFGRSYGGALGVLAGLFIATTRLTPQQWKREFNVGKDKEQSRRRASELMPDATGFWPLKKHDGRAEAALLALYGYRKLNAKGE